MRPWPVTRACRVLCAQVADMRISYTRGGLEESDLAAYIDNPMRAWAEWFKIATEQKVCAFSTLMLPSALLKSLVVRACIKVAGSHKSVPRGGSPISCC